VRTKHGQVAVQREVVGERRRREPPPWLAWFFADMIVITNANHYYCDSQNNGNHAPCAVTSHLLSAGLPVHQHTANMKSVRVCAR
jgi:hypothetical protein